MERKYKSRVSTDKLDAKIEQQKEALEKAKARYEAEKEGYSAMENAIHSTWKSKGQLSHVLQTAFPTAP